ncbi:7749_t:CDS:1, partial [Gigaspora rosea]
METNSYIPAKSKRKKDPENIVDFSTSKKQFKTTSGKILKCK